MKAKEQIEQALEKIMDKTDARACEIYKRFDYDGAVAVRGWYYRKFGERASFLGESLDKALETIEEIRRSREVKL